MFQAYNLFLTATWAGAFLLVAFCVFALVKSRSSSIRNVPGPSPPSWFAGHLHLLFNSEVATVERNCFNEFGHTWRIKGSLGNDILMTADPKAIQYILQTSAYRFQRLHVKRAIVKLITGPSILWAEHEVHKRHRKVMLPAFGMPEARALSPVFRTAVLKMVAVWNTAVTASKDGIVVNMPASLARATLDAIGNAAFDYDFGSVENRDNQLANHFQHLFQKTRGQPSYRKVFFENIVSTVLPLTLLRYLKYIPSSGIQYANRSLKLSNTVAAELVNLKQDDLRTRNSGKDVMTLLVNSNNSEVEKAKLSQDEMLAQMSAIMIAGHETTSNSVTWTLWELAKHPDIQDRLRSEIRSFVFEASERGLDAIPAEDYEKMAYTTAVMKEILRYHNVVIMVMREAAKDCIVPLEYPVRSTTGERLTHIPLQKATKVFISLSQYNRLTALWGSDADAFNPDRWLKAVTPGTRLGVYANLATFGAGIHACIGWRFAIVEMQAFLIELIHHFEFEMTEEARHIKRERAAGMIPLVQGQEDKGIQLPLKVKVAQA
ncbi:cytochrome P450 [Sistotremastrum suecicum HHB10207 ss-3]|uniref:Cytochrome P450 n=1 Tax=Sistotremastrum suecicum HHB10207 ss-3 TaxID=1314776 RepID=A0A166FJV7_9AGAM|nr:cytochrome P450 [Sistotremastrum suecicum HHB10207 ss-3]